MRFQLIKEPLGLLLFVLFKLTFASSVTEASSNQASSQTASSALPSVSSTVLLRVEGPLDTIFEGEVTSGPRYITVTAQGGDTFYCDGTNDNANPEPGNTCLDALDAASKIGGFTYDGGFDGEFNDFYITRIDTVSSPPDGQKFWGLLWNYQVSKFGLGLTLSGCQQEVKDGDEVLYAFIPYNTTDVRYLRVSPQKLKVNKGGEYQVKVYDGMSGNVVKGAVIDGVTTDKNGLALLKFPTRGTFKFKATKTGDVRSVPLTVVVT